MERRSSRRLAAIVAADIAGYSRLMEQDEEATVSALRACRSQVIDPLLAHYNGRVANTAGDSLLLEFPSAVDAVRCAMELQHKTKARNENEPPEKRLTFRIGINVGDVISEGEDLLGDGVNVAARLEALAEPGGICLSRSVRDQIVEKLSLSLEDLGEISVKNISRPVETFRVLPDGQAAPAPRRKRPGWLGGWMPVAAGILAIAIGGFALWSTGQVEFEPASIDAMALPLPDKPSVVVLPFENLSGDPDQTLFADGVTEDLITDLSRLSGLFVIGRNSSFMFRDKDVSIKSVAEQLGVRYVLTGSVRRSGDTLRINAQLLDALSGDHVWAERFDGALSDVFATQDAFTFKVVEALEVELSTSETEQINVRETEQVAAREAFQRGWDLYSRFNERSNNAAIPHFQTALDLDPDYGRAHGALALAHLRGVIFHHWNQFTDQQTGGQMHLQLFPEHLKSATEHETSLIHVVRAMMHLNLRDTRQTGAGAIDDALLEAGQAIAAQPNDPEAHIAMAWALTVAGKPNEALKFVETAMRLDPNFPSHYVLFDAAARFATGDLEAARAALQAGLRNNPDAVELMPFAASVLAQLGQRADAHTLVERWLPGRDWEVRETAVEKYFFIVRWEGDLLRLNHQLQEGLRLAALPPEVSAVSLADTLANGTARQPFRTARQIGWFGASAAPAVPALIKALSSSDGLLRKEAVIALGKIGPEAHEAVPALQKLADQPLIGFHAKTALQLIQKQ